MTSKYPWISGKWHKPITSARSGNPNSVLLGLPCYLMPSCQRFLLKLCLFYAAMSLGFPKHIAIYGICLSWTCAGLRRDASYCCQRLATGWSTQRQQLSACWHPLPSSAPCSFPPFFPRFIVDEYQLWESKGRNILSSQRVVNVTSLLSILNFRINLFDCSFVYSPIHLFMYLGDRTHVNVRGQLTGAFFLLLPCSFWARVKGCQAWWQRFLSAEMPLCPFARICKVLFYF